MNKKRFKVNYYVGIERYTKFFDTINEVKEFTERFPRNEDFIVYEYDDVIGYRLTSIFWKV